MVNPFAYVVRSVQPAVNSIAGVQVDVRYPDGTTVEGITMIPPVERSETEGDGGIVIEVQFRTWTVAASDLPAVPVRGLEITWDGQVYRATHPPGGGKVWDWQDHYRQRYMIRTQLVPISQAARGPYVNANGDAYGTSTDQIYGKP